MLIEIGDFCFNRDNLICLQLLAARGSDGRLINEREFHYITKKGHEGNVIATKQQWDKLNDTTIKSDSFILQSELFFLHEDFKAVLVTKNLSYSGLYQSIIIKKFVSEDESTRRESSRIHYILERLDTTAKRNVVNIHGLTPFDNDIFISEEHLIYIDNKKKEILLHNGWNKEILAKF